MQVPGVKDLKKKKANFKYDFTNTVYILSEECILDF